MRFEREYFGARFKTREDEVSFDAYANESGTLSFARTKSPKDFYGKDDAVKFEREDGKSKAKRIALFVFFGTLVGAVNGLFGAGGGMLAVPVLCFVGGLANKRAHATAIAVMLPLCLASAVVYASSNAVDYSVLIPTCIGVFSGGILGAKLLKVIPAIWLFFIFNLTMLIVGFKMLL
ncbi:MAG: sulfite exporter TauE/SafE family protein [Clostridia bacterium]|nr:sulfite exporter TauE/SafE family protein [Clostridia bacterium]